MCEINGWAMFEFCDLINCWDFYCSNEVNNEEKVLKREKMEQDEVKRRRR